MPGHAGFLFGGYSNGLPFYHNEHTLQSVWELPQASAPSAPARASGAPGAGALVLEEEVPSDDDAPASPGRPPRRPPARAAVAGAAAEEISGEAEVEAALAARRRPHLDWAGPQAPSGSRSAHTQGASSQARAALQTQEELDAVLASIDIYICSFTIFSVFVAFIKI